MAQSSVRQYAVRQSGTHNIYGPTWSCEENMTDELASCRESWPDIDFEPVTRVMTVTAWEQLP